MNESKTVKFIFYENTRFLETQRTLSLKLYRKIFEGKHIGLENLFPQLETTNIHFMVSSSFELFCRKSESGIGNFKLAKRIFFFKARVSINTADATACRAWAQEETLNGLQKVLPILYFPGPTTL